MASKTSNPKKTVETCDMVDFDKKLDSLIEGQSQLFQKLALYEASQADLKVTSDKHEKALYPNGNPGALQDIQSLKARMTMVFSIGGALYALFALVFGLVMEKVLTILTELAKLALTIHA